MMNEFVPLTCVISVLSFTQLCNLCITQVDAKYYLTERELDTLKARITLARMKSIKSESELCELGSQSRFVPLVLSREGRVHWTRFMR